MLGLSSTITDSIVTAINTPNEGHTIEHCDIFGENANPNQATPGKGCIKALPPFAEPKTFDFRLQAGSPCRKAASDGSDMGFAYHLEIQALLRRPPICGIGAKANRSHGALPTVLPGKTAGR